ncbi:hypothetical protein ZIOFF_075652 [Zingiber officinale]|uniref:4-coumarate--CoA ligase n=1 Tax=Zingiber officinale TaxID=94328 RepID=A0A8J5BUP7_ZINOF|nr:hypothetical protein ZIOFF_075652 [Zingiber officinale]
MESVTLTGALKKAAADFPSRLAIAVPGRVELSHARLQQIVDGAAARLVAAGLRTGDVVALVFPNTVELVIAFLAVIRARGVAAPLNPAYTREEFVFYISDSESKLLLTNVEGNAAAEAAAAEIGIPRAAASLPDPSGALEISLPVVQAEANVVGSSFAGCLNDPSDVALFLHTSGTTSRPKGVPLTQLNLAASVKNIRSVYRLRETDSTVIVLPLFHVHGLVAALLSSLSGGAAVTLPAAGRFSASAFWADMRASGATWYTAVPTIHQILLDRHASRPEPAYPHLRFIRSCSASLAPAILEHLEAAFGAPVLEAYAMTEASHQMASNPLPEDAPRKPGAVGRPTGLEMAILDEDGARRPPNVPGEVCIRGLNVTKGYKNNPEANKAAFAFGWFHTGDVGFLDEEGYLHLVARIKELINRGGISQPIRSDLLQFIARSNLNPFSPVAGEKISPIEVDAVLLDHSDIAEAVAFGVPDDKYGEEINCAVVPREGAEIDEDDVVRHCRKNLTAFKVPKKVFITDSLPKTATGKIQRRMVAECFVSPAKAPRAGA